MRSAMQLSSAMKRDFDLQHEGCQGDVKWSGLDKAAAWAVHCDRYITGVSLTANTVPCHCLECSIHVRPDGSVSFLNYMSIACDVCTKQ